MNRRQRRAQSAAKRREAGSVFEYRLPPGKAALTFDIEGRPPATAVITAECLVDAVDAVGRNIMAGLTYERGLSLFVAAFRKTKGDSVVEYALSLLGFWLALNHQQTGHEIRDRVADAIATSNCAHVTFFVARGGAGIAFAVAGAFVDLEAVLGAMPRNAVTLIVPAPRPAPWWRSMSVQLSPRERERLAKLLALLGSDKHGERDAAGLAAHRLIQRVGLSWDQLLAPPIVKREPLHCQWRQTCAELATCSGDLRPWERKFVADLPAFPLLSTKQSRILIGVT